MKIKNYLLAVLVACSALSLSAQKPNEGTIIYEQKLNIHASLAPSQAALKAMVPEFKTSEIEMVFKGNKASLIKEEGGMMVIGGNAKSTSSDKPKKDNVSSIMNGENMTFKNYTVLGEDKYYVEGSASNTKEYKKLAKTKVIKGYICLAVESEGMGGTKMTIWYCPELPKHLSPLGILPIEGTVLEIENNRISFTVKEIKTDKIDDALLNEPKGYTKVSNEQLMDRREEYMEEMRAGMGKVKSFKSKF